MRHEELLRVAEQREPPTKVQLDRLGAYATAAWGTEHVVRYGYEFTKDGYRIYAKQDRRKGNFLQQEGASLGILLARMEEYLASVAYDRTGTHPDELNRLVCLHVGP